MAAKLDALEEKTELLSLQHETFAGNTRAQLKQVFEAIRQLMTPADPPRRQIGFVKTEEIGQAKRGRKQSWQVQCLMASLRIPLPRLINYRFGVDSTY